ncbi:MAG: amino acid ABC transporter substrate-binding protein [Alphaproteobacteria bacterium]|nr:amino acid ABC transporter substrate-binding protein [Alphaproteobacteria bacterium]
MTQFTISRRTLLGGGAALVATAPIALAETPGTLAKIKSAGVWVVGNGGAYPPFEFVEDGKLVGFDRDLGDELGTRMGVRVDWQVIEFAGLIAGLTSGRVDTLITAFTWTKERAERVTFSNSYYKTGIAAAYRPDVKLVEPADLAGKIVGVQTGTAGDKFVRDSYADKLKELKTYPEFPLALRDLEIGRVEAVVNTQPVLRYNLTKSNKAGLKVTGLWDSRDVGINTRMTDQDLLAEINKHLAAMHQDGFLKGLDAKWFGAA